MRRFALILALAVFASFLWGSAALAHGTDLNTIWTTEVADEGTFEWDLNIAFSDTEFNYFFAEDGRFLSQDFYAGILPNFEIGMAFNAEREVGPFILFAKYKVFCEEDEGIRGGFPVSLAVGVDNVIGTHDRFVSEPIPYIVIGKNFDKGNGYLGFAHNASGWEDDNSIFGGIDYNWTDVWTLAVDYYGYLDNEESIISGGIYYDWAKHFNWGGWASYDSATENTIFVFEMAFTGRFDDLEADA
jgi:hypothetical protein